MKSKICLIVYCLVFQLISLPNCYSQKIASVIKISHAYISNQAYLPDFIKAEKVRNSIFSERTISYELNFLKNNFIGINTSNDQFHFDYEIEYDTSKLNELVGQMLPLSGEQNYRSIYLGGHIPTFKKFNQSFSFAGGISQVRGRSYSITKVFLRTNYYNDYWIVVAETKTIKYNHIAPLLQAGYDFNFFKSRMNVGLKFSAKVLPESGWRYYYGISLGYNFKKAVPHKQDFKSFIDFVTVDKEEKAKWNDVKAYKNTIRVENSTPYFSYWKNGLLRVYIPGISYQRKFGNHFIAGANFNFWLIYTESFLNNGLSNYKNYNDTVNSSARNFKTISSFVGYKINVSKFAKQTISFSIGSAYSWGINGSIKKVDYWNWDVVEAKVNYTSPLIQLEYNINPIKNHLNLGAHARAKYFPGFHYEFDFGIHAGVNF